MSKIPEILISAILTCRFLSYGHLNNGGHAHFGRNPQNWVGRISGTVSPIKLKFGISAFSAQISI
jgi:hypothetical protein